ncbi:hypothetical protein HanIR_Chr04g0173711 [Helianthus annuus]|nr:hypothetical protein HanIR_Chr04g0173711 [Helianthus annuus]
MWSCHVASGQVSCSLNVGCLSGNTGQAWVPRMAPMSNTQPPDDVGWIFADVESSCPCLLQNNKPLASPRGTPGGGSVTKLRRESK